VAREGEERGGGEGGNPAVILCAAYLHDMGIKEAEKEHKSTEAEPHEEAGPPIARETLTRLGAKDALIDEVCDIVGHHHHPGKEESINFKSLYDADLIANLVEKHKESPMTSETFRDTLSGSFLTETGRDLAKKVLLS